MEYVQTVLGEISPKDMGIVLPHEHIIWDLRCLQLNPMLFKKERIQMDNLPLVKYDRMSYEKNLIQQNWRIAQKEVQYYKACGGGTICDNGSYGIGCDIKKLQKISQKTGVHILKGTGAYLGRSLPKEIASLSVNGLAELFIKEIYDGVGKSGIKCGFIGEIGVESEDAKRSEITLKAAARAQKETGAALLIHQPGIARWADWILDVIVQEGGNVEKTVMCHCDPYIPDHKYIDSIAKRGAYISFDFFGLDIPLGTPIPTTDNDRVFAITEQIKRGNVNKILMSHDVAYKIMLRWFGGLGYAHIVERILPQLKSIGCQTEWIEQITKKNPQKVFSMVR